MLFPALLLTLALDTPTLDWTLTHREGPEGVFWEVEVAIAGLDRRSRDVHLELSDFGEWAELEGDYLLDLAGEPPVEWRDGKLVFDLPRRWDGALRVTYRIAANEVGGEGFRRHGLLPHHRRGAAAYSSGNSSNTLPELGGREAPEELVRRLRLVAPEGWTVFSGWSGAAGGGTTMTLRAETKNTVIAFGLPIGLARRAIGEHTVEAIQLGEGDDCTERVLDLAAVLVPEMARTTGRNTPYPVHFLITDASAGGGMGSDGAVSLGYSPDMSREEPSPWRVHHIAHELFHSWLPGLLEVEGSSLVWCFEGFTEYMAAWHAAATGLITHDWFRERIEFLGRDAAGNPVREATSFADPSVGWREGDNESLAYHGGAALGFLIDVELRAKGHPGLPEMIGDHAGGVLSQDSIRKWLKAHGLAKVHQRYVQGSEAPDVRALLERIGYAEGRRDAYVTYFGVRTDGGVAPGEVLAIDQEGPAVGSDLRVGDVILDYAPKRASELFLKDGYGPGHAFGLTLFDPEGGGCSVRVRRGEAELDVPLVPWLSPGGFEHGLVADAAEIAPFFRFER